jgi:hypothetical protein
VLLLPWLELTSSQSRNGYKACIHTFFKVITTAVILPNVYSKPLTWVFTASIANEGKKPSVNLADDFQTEQETVYSEAPVSPLQYIIYLLRLTLCIAST